MKKVSVIVPLFNAVKSLGEEDYSKCVDSVLNQDYNNIEVILTDDASTDNTVEFSRKKGGKLVKIIVNKKNKGFAGNVNMGIRNATGDYILILNDDAYLEKSAVSKLVETTESNEKIGVVAPLIYNWGERRLQHYGSGGFKTFWATNKQVKPHDNAYEVDWVKGACFMVRREVFEKVGLLWEKFGSFYEETDFQDRIRRAGFSILVEPNAKVYHRVHSSTFSKMKGLSLFLLERNRIIYLYRNYSLLKFILLSFIDFLKIFYRFFKIKRFYYFKITFKAKMKAFKIIFSGEVKGNFFLS